MPGTSYILYSCSGYLRSARANRNVGLTAALRMLLRVEKQCRQQQQQRMFNKAVVHLEALQAWAKEAGQDRGDFSDAGLVWRADFELHGESWSMTLVRLQMHHCLVEHP